MEKLTNNLTNLRLGDQLCYLKQPPGFATKAIHVAQEPGRWKSRSIVPPIVTSTIYEASIPVKDCEHFYGRLSNPTRSVLEENLASLDNAKYALVFAAGVGGITAIISSLSAGDGIIASKYFYTGTIDVFSVAKRLGVEVQYVDFDDLKNVENALKPNTKIVWAEPSINPLMTVIDIRALSDMVHSKSKALVIVDNTFLTPYFHRPLELGADVAFYSLTKYFGGHSDVLGGSICVNDENLYKMYKTSQTVTGTMSKQVFWKLLICFNLIFFKVSPFDCYLINRSVKTLAVS